MTPADAAKFLLSLVTVAPPEKIGGIEIRAVEHCPKNKVYLVSGDSVTIIEIDEPETTT